MPKTPEKTTKKSKQSKATNAAKPGKRLSRLRAMRPRRRTSRRQPRPAKKLTGSFRLFIDSSSLVRQHWKLFGGITLVYFALSMILVGGLSGQYSISELKDTFAEEFGRLSASLALFGLLVSSTGGSASESGAAYQTIVILLVSLATIWALRQVLAGEKVGIRDAFYKGMYPLVPLVLVLLFMCLLFAPALVAGFVFNVVIVGGLAVTALEYVLWMGLVVLLLSWTLYMVVTRVFAIYIVTLPDMRPMAAIKAARKLVRYRRWSIIRKLLFLPFALVVIGAVIVLPLIMLVPAVVQWVFVLLSMFALVFAHAYTYSLYKELL